MKTVYFLISIVCACLIWQAYAMITKDAWLISDVMIMAGDRWPWMLIIVGALIGHWWWRYKKHL